MSGVGWRLPPPSSTERYCKPLGSVTNSLRKRFFSRSCGPSRWSPRARRRWQHGRCSAVKCALGTLQDAARDASESRWSALLALLLHDERSMPPLGCIISDNDDAANAQEAEMQANRLVRRRRWRCLPGWESQMQATVASPPSGCEPIMRCSVRSNTRASAGLRRRGGAHGRGRHPGDDTRDAELRAPRGPWSGGGQCAGLGWRDRRRR